MSVGDQILDFSSSARVMFGHQTNWYAIQTRARHEKVVAERLGEQGVVTFLPLVREIHRWSDRKKKIELPLFSCYVFGRFAATNEEQQRIYRTTGVFGIVGVRGECTPIPDAEIEAVRAFIGQHLPWSVHPFLKVGQRVRVRGGSLDGIEGVLLSRNGERTLVISINTIQRSLAVRIEGYDLEAV
jgi:transcription termination/antitermination protein NusG